MGLRVHLAFFLGGTVLKCLQYVWIYLKKRDKQKEKQVGWLNVKVGKHLHFLFFYYTSGSLADPNICINSHSSPGSTHLLLITTLLFFLPTTSHSSCSLLNMCVCVFVHVTSFNEQTAGLFMPLCVVCLSFWYMRDLVDVNGGPKIIDFTLCLFSLLPSAHELWSEEGPWMHTDKHAQ